MNLIELLDELNFYTKRKASTHGGEYCGPCPFCKEGKDRFLVWPKRCNKNGEYFGGRFLCRVCGKYGNAVNFLCNLYGLSFSEACSRLRLEPLKRQGIKSTWKPYQPPIANDPPILWIEKASAFVEWCHSKLMDSPAALDQIQARGLTIDTIMRYKIGFNPGDARERDFKRDRRDWGLPEIFKEDGSVRKLWLPVGFTIPTLSEDKHVLKIKIRRIGWHDGDKLPKYVEISGSKSSPSVYGDLSLSVGLVLESEFDGLLIQQEARDLLYCIALGGSTKQIDANTHALLKRTEKVLFLLDFDKAGAIAWSKWKKIFPSIIRILTPHEKSAGDYFLAEGDLRSWLMDYCKIKATT